MFSEIQTIPVVSVKDGAVYANSRDVASFFGKRHDNVVRDISTLLMGLLKSEDTPSFNLFKPSPYVASNGETYGSYDMTKDGFTLLVMGYTGAKAMQFKLAYIQRFNEMEETLKTVPAVPRTYLEALKATIAAVERAEEAEGRAEAAECVVNRLAAYPDMLGVQEAAKALKIAPKEFGRLLREWRWVYDRRGAKKSKMLAYQDTIDRGLMVHDAVELDDGSIKYHPKLTGKGLTEAARRLEDLH